MRKFFKRKKGAATVSTAIITASATSGAASVGAAWAGDDVMAWVMLAINIITLLSNLALEVYKQWRDKDKEPGKKEERDEDEEAEK